MSIISIQFTITPSVGGCDCMLLVF